MEVVLPAELFATQGTVCSLGPFESVIWLPSYFLLSNALFHYVEAAPWLCVMWSVRDTLVL